MSNLGKARRLSRILNPLDLRTLIVPLDDVLLAGPEGGLRNVDSKIEQVTRGEKPDAIAGFKGLFLRNCPRLAGVGCIMNLTASTTRMNHTRKTLVSSVEDALALDMDAVAIHVNITSSFETEMLEILGKISSECERVGMPLVAFMYPRGEVDGKDNNYESLRDSSPSSYAELVRHTARIAVDLGADMIKTQYTGDPESFRTVVESCSGIPIVIAGGPIKEPSVVMGNAYGAICAGAAGVSFGRNVFHRRDSDLFTKALRGIVHDHWTTRKAMDFLIEQSAK